MSIQIPEEYKESSCTCKECVSMCKRRPCWPTPNEAKAIIKAGYGGRLMKDYWAKFPEDINILAPAIVGYEGKHSPFLPLGKCTFLTEEGLCELHDKGLKPLEGRVVDCSDVEYEVNPHEFISTVWDTKEGQELVKEWQLAKVHNLSLE